MAKVIERLRKGTSTVQTVLYGRGADARSQTGEYTVTGLTTDSAYQIRPYVIEDGTVVYGSALTFRTAPQATVAYPIPRKIDMGMPSGVLWGEWNLGAQSVTDTGEYYGWGYWEGMPGGITGTNDYYYARYSNNEPFIGYSIVGSDFDIVHMTWGGGWRMATSAEFDWLFDGNNSYQDPNEDQYITVNGSRVHGRKLHSKQNSSNMLFFPATGYYVGDEAISDNYSRTWSSDKEKKDGITTYIYYLVAGSITRKNHDHKYIRFPIRPVWDPVLAANSGNYSFMALSSSTDMRVSMKDYTGNYVSNSQTEASFTYSFTLRSGVTEYGILVGNTGSELKISNSIKREAIPVGLQEVLKIVLPSGDYWEKGSGGSSGGDTPDTPVVPSETPSNAVDLGLYSGNLWATYNVGATSETESGVYVAWGELQEKINEGYFKENYAYLDANNTQYGGYSTALGNNIAGTKYDIAHVRWGGTWHMPTDSDFKELRDDCTWTQETRRGVLGYKVTGPNGNSIFLPCAGYYNGNDFLKDNEEGNYWCSTMYLFAREYQMGYAMNFSQANGYELTRYSRKGGLTVRPCMPGGSGGQGGNTPVVPDIPDPEDDTTGTPSLDLRIVGISTDNHILLNTELNNTNVALSGAGSMVIHVKSEHTGGIVSSNCVLIDNFGYFIERTSGYGKWPGGTTSSTTNKEITFSTVNTPKVNAKMTVMSTVDEDNHTLLRGDMCSKAIRVPAAGTSSSISVSKYPYDFASPLFFTPMVMSPVYIDPITNEGSLGSYVEETYSTDGFSATIQEGNTALDNIVSYSISTNSSNKYKEYILYIAPLYGNYQIGEPYGYDGVMLHFIQEPLVKNRVYYGSGFSASKTFSDKNYNNPSGFEYHAFFETANSKILKKEFTLSVKEGNYCAWPNDGDYDMDFGATQYDIVKVNYMWGNQSYTVARINSYMGNVQFKEKG